MIAKKDIGSLFDRLAKRYDLFNHLSSFGIDIYWRRKAMQQMVATDHVLDVAIGTADFALAMLREQKAKQVTGIDLSTEMMAVGAEKAKREGLGDRITFREANAQKMPYEDATFDAVTCAYGVRNFAQLDEGLHEMYRVLRQGGQLMILEFSYPTNPVFAALYTFYFRYILTTIGAILTKNRSDFNYFYHSVQNFPRPANFVEILKSHGFIDISAMQMTFGISTLYVAKKAE